MSIFEHESWAIFAEILKNTHKLITEKLLKKFSIFRTKPCCSLRSCSFESISDVMETRGYTLYCTA